MKIFRHHNNIENITNGYGNIAKGYETTAIYI